MWKLVTVKKVQENCGDTAVRIIHEASYTARQNKIQICKKTKQKQKQKKNRKKVNWCN